MKATVIGCGRWGSFIAWYLRKIGHEVTLYGREGSKHIEQFRQMRSNGLVTLEADVRVTTDLREALQSELICISIRSQNLPELMAQIAAQGVSGKTFTLCMKGIEVTTLRRLSEIAEEAVGGSNDVAVWLGPGHVQEFLAGVPNCMVIDSNSEAVKERLISQLSGGLIRFYYGTDLIGNEVGAAAKNVIGIAAGMLDGMGLSSLKGALMSRGTREVSRLIAAMGGNGFSAYVHQFLSQLAASHSRIADCEIESVCNRIAQIVIIYQMKAMTKEDFFQFLRSFTIYFHFIQEVILSFIGRFQHGSHSKLRRVACS